MAAAQRFDGPAFFREIRLFNQLLTPPGEQRWVLRPPKQPEPRQVVLYLGCNVLRTNHLVRTVCDVLDLLGVDYVAVGGGAYCCGIGYRRAGESSAADTMAQNTLRYFAAFQPERVVMWCPTCIYVYDELLQADVPYRVQHATEFLVEHLDRFAFARAVPARVALHRHVGFPAREREATAAATLLSAVPGVELLDPGADAAMGRSCRWTGDPVADERWRQMACAQLDSAVALGADTFATLYHSCQRLFCGFERSYPLRIEHYLTVFARALGIEHEDRFKRYLLSGNVQEILEDVAPCVRANGVAEAEARALVAKHFTRELAL